jgi:hypothetical protein
MSSCRFWTAHLIIDRRFFENNLENIPKRYTEFVIWSVVFD